MGKQKTGFRWVILFILVFGNAMLNFSNLIFASRPTDVMAQFNMTQAQLTAISTVGMLPGAFLSVYLGNLLDKRGVRKITAVLLALAAACQIWRVFAGSYVELVLITLLAGTFFLPVSIIAPKMVGLWFPREEAGTAMGVYGAAAGIGTTLAFAVGGLFPTSRSAFAVIAGGYVLMFVLWVLCAKESPARAEAGAAPPAPPKGSLGKVVRSRNMWLVMICGGLAVGAALLLNSYMINALLGKGLPAASASGLTTLLNVCLVIGGVVSGVVVSRLGRYNPPYAVICIGGAALYYAAYMLPFGPATYMLFALGGLVCSGSIGVNMARVGLLPLTGEFGPENTGAAGGMLNTMVGICSFVVPTLVSMAAGDNYNLIFLIIAVFLVLIGLLGGFAIPELGERGKLARQAQSSVHT